MNEFEKFIKNIEKLSNKIINFFHNSEIDFKEVVERLDYIQNKLPKNIKNVSNSLMNRGWFIFDIVLHQEGLIHTNSTKQDEYMKDYISSNINIIRQILIDTYPNRKQQIEDAFQAHENKLYFCSIPTFLAIAEGIGQDLYNISIFAKEQKAPKTRKLLKKIEKADDFTQASYTSLYESSKITESIKNPTNIEKTRLNRHLIMHGISDNYGNKINSLKTISLVFYIHNSLNFLSSEY